MKLIRLHINNFGTFSDYRMELSSGIYVLHAANGWGKSTLAVFIKAMLYGLPATTKRSLDDNERKKYAPWQGGDYGGSLEFETERGRFRIERSFAQKERGDTFALYDLFTNRETDVYSDPVGETLFGIDADGFERTLYLSSRTVPSLENGSITGRLVGLLDDVEDIGSFEDAMELLDKRRKYYVMTGDRGRISELERQRLLANEELERLLRIKQTLAYTSELQAQNKLAEEETRRNLNAFQKELQTLGAAREKNAHIETRDRMQKALAQKRAERDRLNSALRGEHPDDEVFLVWEKSLGDLEAAEADLKAVSERPSRSASLELLSLDRIESVPTEETLSKMTEDVRSVEGLTHRIESLRDAQSSVIRRRFSNGVPERARIDGAFASLEKAKQYASAAQAHQVPKKHTPIGAILFALLSVLLAGLGIWQNAYLPILLGAAGVCLILSILLLSVHRAKHRRLSRLEAEEHAKQLQEKDKILFSVEKFLASYGISDLDPVRGLTALRLSLDQYEEEAASYEERRRQMMQLEGERKRILEQLSTAFRCYGLALPQDAELRDSIEAIRRDLRLWKAQKEAQSNWCRRRSAATDRVGAAKDALLPISRLFDPEGAWEPRALFAHIKGLEANYRRTLNEIRQETEALSVFIKEKHLENADAPAIADDQALITRHQETQDTLEQLLQKGHKLEAQVDHLTEQVERISEVKSTLEGIEEELSMARANSKTIEHTKRFLETAKDALSTRYLGQMRESLASYMGALEAQTPPESFIDPAFKVTIRKGGKTRTLESFSKGQRDLVQFCLRLSLVEALYRDGERPFLVLDDPFVHLDDAHLSSATKLLRTLSSKYQILYLVCHSERGGLAT